MVMDVETEFPGGTNLPVYKPVNYDGKFHGPQQLRYALGNSYNIPAVKVLALGGIKNMLILAEQMGLTTLAPTEENLARFGLSLTLGGGDVKLLDMVNAYSVFINSGVKQQQVAILKVTDVGGKVLDEFKQSDGKKVLSEEISYLLFNILSDNDSRAQAFGANSFLNIAGRKVAVKTGTTDQKRDNWTVGYTPLLTTGVWVGNNDNSVMDPKIASGVTGASPIWQRIMTAALKDKPNETLPKPESVVDVEIDGLMPWRFWRCRYRSKSNRISYAFKFRNTQCGR
jgi:membrane peptidoglycan carboxypeptidase